MWQFFLKALGIRSFTPSAQPAPQAPAKENTVQSKENQAPAKEKPVTASAAEFISDLITIATVEAVKRIRETSRNQGPGIEKYWTATDYGVDGYKNREPWCGATLCFIVREAAIKCFGDAIPFKLPKSAGVVRWIEWAKNAKGWKFLPASTPVKQGDVVLFDFNGSRASGTHIALAVSDEKGLTFETIEGNTDGAGSREGNGVYKKSRNRDRCIGLCRYVG